MDDSIIDTAILPTEADRLDQEIEELQTQARRLKRHLSQHTTNILSSSHSAAIISQLQTTPQDVNPLHETAALQTQHNLTTLYRTCATVTSFMVKDPDPVAVDHGRVLGLRFESFNSTNGKYQRPFYVFLNKPYARLGPEGKAILRVHRHTLPPAINIAELAGRYLPTPKGLDVLKVRKQSLHSFVRSLRREITSYGNRMAIIKATRTKLGLDRNAIRSKRQDPDLGEVSNISAVDAEARQIRIEWSDGRVGRLRMSANGVLEDCIVIEYNARQRSTERRLMQAGPRIENVLNELVS